jgi:hypothetical protein
MSPESRTLSFPQILRAPEQTFKKIKNWRFAHERKEFEDKRAIDGKNGRGKDAVGILANSPFRSEKSPNPDWTPQKAQTLLAVKHFPRVPNTKAIGLSMH